MGVVSCFLCSPDSSDRDPVALFDFLHVFFKETEQSHHHNNKSSPPLFYKHVLDFQLWVISRPQSHAKGQHFDENNVMQRLHRNYWAELSGDQTDIEYDCC